MYKLYMIICVLYKHMQYIFNLFSCKLAIYEESSKTAIVKYC